VSSLTTKMKKIAFSTITLIGLDTHFPSLVRQDGVLGKGLVRIAETRFGLKYGRTGTST
jgi:hypothetical protein